MPKQVINIQSPAGGYFKRRGYQDHPPFTSPDCQNVRIDDAIVGRERIGSRPGIPSAGVGTPSSSGPIKMLQTVRHYEEGLGWRETLVAIKNRIVSYSTNGTSWTTAIGPPLVDGSPSPLQYMGADYKQQLYIATGTDKFAIFEPFLGTIDVEPTETAGTIPPHCRILIRYRDRLLMTGDPNNPHLWYMSRSGDPLDWDTNKTDVLSAVTAQTSDAGQVGEPIRAAIPHGDDCVIFGCDRSIWTLRSDPNFGGTLDNLSQRVGIVDKHAWTRTPGGWLFFLTQDGVMVMRPGCGDIPISISRELLPEELLQMTGDLIAPASGPKQAITMEYDMRFRGIHLFITPSGAGSAGIHYWLDIKQLLNQDAGNSATFWPQTMSNAIQPYSTTTFESLGSATASSAVFGGHNGVMYNFDQGVNCEQASHVDIGPIATMGRSGNYFDGSLDIINSVKATGSGNIDYEIRSGESPEACYDASSEISGTWIKKHNMNRIRLRNPYFIIRLKGAVDIDWAMENMTTVVNPRGRQRFRK